MAAHGARGRRAACPLRHRRRSDDEARRLADRAAAADRDRPRAVLRRAHRHPGRADLRPLPARGRATLHHPSTIARGRHQHRLHLALHRRHSACVRHGDRVPQRPEGRRGSERRNDQGRADRGHDRPRWRGARAQLHRRSDAAAAERQSGGSEGRPALAGAEPEGHLLRGPRRRGARHLRLHGLRPAGAVAHPVRQAEA